MELRQRLVGQGGSSAGGPGPVLLRLTYDLSAVGTTDPDTGDSIAYAWNFGDTANNTAVGASTSDVLTHRGPTR